MFQVSLTGRQVQVLLVLLDRPVDLVVLPDLGVPGSLVYLVFQVHRAVLGCRHALEYQVRPPDLCHRGFQWGRLDQLHLVVPWGLLIN